MGRRVGRETVPLPRIRRYRMAQTRQIGKLDELMDGALTERFNYEMELTGQVPGQVDMDGGVSIPKVVQFGNN